MRIKNLYLLTLLLLIGLSSQSQTVIPGGYVSGTWTEAGSPYDVRGTITIHEDSSLLITNGVVITFRDGVKMIVKGHISAIGDILPDDQVTFEGFDFSDGIFIDIYQTGIDTCRFVFCNFEMAHNGSNTDGGAMEVENRNEVIISNCTFWCNSAEKRGGAMYLNNSDILIENSKFENNFVWNDTIGRGGAVYMVNSDPIIRNSEFWFNETLNGAALYCVNSSPRIENTKFCHNTSHAGGGAIVFNNSGQPVFKDCLLWDNDANGSGGAIAFLEGINCTFENCRFIDNTSTSDIYLADGGAVMITPYDNNVGFSNCEFSENYAEDFGGALYATSPTNVIGCLFNGNSMASSAPSGGGAICLGESSMRIINSTFTNNSALFGPGIFSEDSELLILNSIIWDDSVTAEPQIFLSTNTDPPSLYVDHSNIQGGLGTVTGTGAYQVHWAQGNLNTDPHFILSGENLRLTWNSPCINAGRIDTLQLLIPAEDFDGNPRIMGGEIDMGCYEYQDPISIPEIKQDQDFLVYPNPVREYFFIKNITGTDFSGQIILSDLAGRKIVDRRISIGVHSSYNLSISGIPEGMYILNILSEKSRTVKKLLVTGY